MAQQPISTDSGLPPHVEGTLRAVEELHVEHWRSASRADRILEEIKAQISRPRFIVVLLVLVCAWIVANIEVPGGFPDPPPFAYLSLVLTFGAVCLTVLVLSTQQRADRLADHREKLILQLTHVSEQKTAKLIALVEELRRDDPQIRDRLDTEAQQMTEATDVAAVSEALRSDAVASGGSADPDSP